MTDATIEQLREENNRLRQAIDELSILNDLARSISAQKDSEDIMHTIVRRSIRAVAAEQGVITLVQEDNSDSIKTLIRSMVSTLGQEKYHFNQELLGWMYLNKKPLLINDPENDTRFRNLSEELNFRTLIAVPLLVKSRLTGILTLYDRKDKGVFTEDNARLLAIIAGQSAQIVENARLEEEERQYTKMREELTVAASIQNDLLPASLLEIPGYDLYASTLPAASVGGDYYDFLQSTTPLASVCVGDVSGKGMPAALLMANLQATLRAGLEASGKPGKVLEQSNRLLYRSTSPEKFATVFLGTIDNALHELTYANAGHDPAIIYSMDGSIKELPATGLPVGLFESADYEEEKVTLNPEDVLVVFSDGITESMDTKSDQFGRDRIIEALEKTKGHPVNDIAKALLDSVTQFSTGAPQSDDMTLLILKRT
jgi:sigma-B regulation protein RsbU (phosphoserine phosphatase)